MESKQYLPFSKLVVITILSATILGCSHNSSKDDLQQASGNSSESAKTVSNEVSGDGSRTVQVLDGSVEISTDPNTLLGNTNNGLPIKKKSDGSLVVDQGLTTLNAEENGSLDLNVGSGTVVAKTKNEKIKSKLPDLEQQLSQTLEKSDLENLDLDKYQALSLDGNSLDVNTPIDSDIDVNVSTPLNGNDIGVDVADVVDVNDVADINDISNVVDIDALDITDTSIENLIDADTDAVIPVDVDVDNNVVNQIF